MADSIVRLKVENSEYDAKIKRAAQGLQHMEEACRKVGGTLAVLEKDEREFVRSLGKMETVSKDARGRVNELTKAFTDLSVQYNRLSKEEKNGDYGKLLKASLGEISERIRGANSELKGISNELGGSSSVLDKFSGLVGVGASKLGLLGVAASATTAALGVMKDAFFANEQNLDEWGRIVESTKSVYQGFIDSLNNGDFSGYFGSINDIIKAARDAYDAIDELATYNAFNQINVQKTRAGLSNAINDFREGKGSKEDVKSAADKLKNELTTRQKKEDEAYKAAVNELAKERSVDSKLLLDALSGSYGNYKELQSVMPSKQETRFTPGGAFGGSQAYTVYTPANMQEKLGQALRQLNDTELESLQKLGAQAEMTALEIAQVDRQVLRYTNGTTQRKTAGNGGRNGGGLIPMKAMEGLTFGHNSIASIEKDIAKYEKVYKNAGDEQGRAWAHGIIEGLKNELVNMTDGNNLLKNALKDVKIQTVDLPDIGKDMATSWQSAAAAIGNVGSALAAIEDPSVRVMGIIAEAIANVALSFAQSLKGTFGPWDWIAAAAGGVGTMLSTISAIKSATEYHAQGGIVGSGLKRGTDVIPAMLSDGELVMNRAQQSNVAAALRNNGINNLRLETRLSGRDIRVILNNDTQSRGMGTYKIG